MSGLLLEQGFATRTRERQPRKSERTRQLIFDAALEFLWTQPFREMSVQRLMAGTDLSRPTFYQYFKDLHELMEALLLELEQEVWQAASLWQAGGGERIARLEASLRKLVDVCYRRGPFIRAIVDAAPMDQRLEKAWEDFLSGVDTLVTAKIESEQALGLIPPFDALPVATALNRMDVLTFATSFGRRPRARPEPVLASITRIWTSTLYPAASTAQATETLTGKLT